MSVWDSRKSCWGDLDKSWGTRTMKWDSIQLLLQETSRTTSKASKSANGPYVTGWYILSHVEEVKPTKSRHVDNQALHCRQLGTPPVLSHLTTICQILLIATANERRNNVVYVLMAAKPNMQWANLFVLAFARAQLACVFLIWMYESFSLESDLWMQSMSMWNVFRDGEIPLRPGVPSSHAPSAATNIVLLEQRSSDWPRTLVIRSSSNRYTDVTKFSSIHTYTHTHSPCGWLIGSVFHSYRNARFLHHHILHGCVRRANLILLFLVVLLRFTLWSGSEFGSCSAPNSEGGRDRRSIRWSHSHREKW